MLGKLRCLFIAAALVPQLSCDRNEDVVSGGSKPTITSVSPATVYPGQEGVRATILGTNFGGTVGIKMGDGILINKTKVIDSTEVTVRFTVTQDAKPGPRSVLLATTGGIVASQNAFSVAENKGPVANFSMNPGNPYRGQEITFDARSSSDPDGSISSYKWDFGDGGKASGMVATHTYAASGSFQVTLTVSDNLYGKATSTRNISVASRTLPVAHMNITPTQGNTATEFRFDGGTSTIASGKIREYHWDFGDGTTAQGLTASHRYSSSNQFAVTLKVVDSYGGTDEVQKSVKVTSHPPVPQLNISPASGGIGTEYTFDASASSDPDGSIVAFDWLIDGQVKTGAIVTHTFSTAGDKTVLLSVMDNDGESATLSRNLKVGATAPPSGPYCPPPAVLVNSTTCCYKKKCCEGKPVELGSIGWCSGTLQCTAGSGGYKPPLPGFDTYPGKPCSEFP